MPILRNLIFRAARRIAADERIQKKAAETYHDEIKPRAEAAWLATKPRIDKTRDDIKKIAQETKPAEEPAQFAGRAVRRVLDEFTSKKSKK